MTANGLTALEGLPAQALLHTYDHVYATLRHAILSGAIPAGTRMVETELSSRLAVSRTPVRDALRRLEGDCLVRRDGGRGLVAVALTLEEVDGIFMVRMELERLAARVAATRVTPERWDPLRLMAHDLGPLATDITSLHFSELHQRLHAEVYALAFTPAAAHVLGDRLLGATGVSAILSYATPRSDEPAEDQHVELVEALASGDPDVAALEAEAHVQRAWEDARAGLAARGEA
jgi:DNA-binding GntR family transcriptional regulator